MRLFQVPVPHIVRRNRRTETPVRVLSLLLLLGMSFRCSTSRAAAFVPHHAPCNRHAVSTLAAIVGIAMRLPTSSNGLVLYSSKDNQKSTSSQSERRQPWEVLRFLQQSSKFVNLPFLNNNNKNPFLRVQPGDVLWQPAASSTSSSKSSTSSFTFAPLDDVVMGGASSSTFDKATGIWSGTVTDANNGGFVGIRNTPAVNWDMTDCQGLKYKLKTTASTLTSASATSSDKRFKFVVRDSTDFNGVTWSTSLVVPPNTISSVRVPLKTLIPALFAKTVPNSPPFRKDTVAGVQIAFSKFEFDGALNPTFAVGPVQLQIIELTAY